LYAADGFAALQEIRRKKPLPANRVDAAIEAAVVCFATEQPVYGQLRVSNELKKQGLFISPGGVRAVWQRHSLESFKKRLQSLEAKAAAEHLVLNEAQLCALAQDTFYVGTLKGVGRVYQQTFIDTYTREAHVKLYARKNALMAADTLNDRVLPWFEEQAVRLLRILTDRGIEYCGSIAHHEYELYLALEEIDHSKTKARYLQTNGIGERFHRTMLEEFYQVAFRTSVYTSLEQLQADVDR
jgi:transposase InsO family protein